MIVRQKEVNQVSGSDGTLFSFAVVSFIADQNHQTIQHQCIIVFFFQRLFYRRSRLGAPFAQKSGSKMSQIPVPPLLRFC